MITTIPCQNCHILVETDKTHCPYCKAPQSHISYADLIKLQQKDMEQWCKKLEGKYWWALVQDVNENTCLYVKNLEARVDWSKEGITWNIPHGQTITKMVLNLK